MVSSNGELDAQCLFDTSCQASSVAWYGGEIFATDVDIDKIIYNAREEQRSDTIKRLLDAALHPRSEHFPRDERLISSQSLMWLSEIHEDIDMEQWIRATLLYADLQLSFEQIPSDPFHVERIFELEPKRDIQDFLQHFVFVPSGQYQIGCKSSAIDGSEPPAAFHYIRQACFSIMRTPVTNAIWNSFVRTPKVIGHPTFPVINVSFFEAAQFASIVTDIFRGHFGRSTFQFRLPSEYEWEVAASGPLHLRYPWGNYFDSSRCNSGMRISRPVQVSSYSPLGDSPFGCQDMSGNIRELD